MLELKFTVERNYYFVVTKTTPQQLNEQFAVIKTVT
jgi:hypothetical protein